ncbi:MAG: FecR family protein [Planctomycetota bacterium]|nr:FecR family protein [Planctomycetota bacterium]
MSDSKRNIEPAPRPLDEQELQRFIDGRLDTERQEALQGRMKHDAAARRALDGLREEDQLLRAALEPLSEPQGKLAEKVLGTLYDEHRQRMRLLRARRVRRMVLGAVGMAAAVMLAVLFIQPREQAGSVLSGSGVGLLQRDGAVQPLQAGQPFYDGDTLVTAHGQFARVRLSDGSVLDLDEDGKLHVEQTKNASPIVLLSAGRMGVEVGAQSLDLTVKTTVGAPDVVRAPASASLDIWLAAPSAARWPAWAAAWEPEAPAAPGVRRVMLTVREGSAYVFSPGRAQPLALAADRCTLFGGDLPVSAGREIDAFQALDNRREDWARFEAGPQDRPLLGLLEPWKPETLGQDLGLTRDLPGGAATEADVQRALQQMAEALRIAEPADRAQRLGAAQQALRGATQNLLLRDERRYLERTLEGLAHYERGRALLAERAGSSRADARNAFLAAAVAFHEALAGGGAEEAGVEVAKPLGERPLPEIRLLSQLSGFAAPMQGKLYATFYRPWALLQLRLLDDPAAPHAGDSDVLALDEAKLFEQAQAMLGSSIEAFAAQYGRARALARQGRADDACAEFEKLACVSVAGLSKAAHVELDGLRQAAHVELIRLYAGGANAPALELWMDAFQLRFPLDLDSRAGQALREVLGRALRAGAERALRKNDYASALAFYADLFTHAGLEATLAPAERWSVRVGQLEAYVATGDGRRAARVARDLSARVPEDLSVPERARFDALIEKARLLQQRHAAGERTEDAAQPEAIQLDLSE